MKLIESLINKSKKHLKENKIPLDYLSKHISKSNNLNEEEVRKQVSEHFLNQYLKSNSSKSFSQFMEEELEQEIEEMDMSSVPVSVRPERPVKEETGLSNFDLAILKLLKQKAKELDNQKFNSWYVKEFILKSGNKDSVKEILNHLGVSKMKSTDELYKKLT